MVQSQEEMGSRALLVASPQTIMDLSKFKTLALVAVAAGLTAQPVSATGSQTVAEDNYYVRSCGGEKSCGGYVKPYSQTNPAPIAMDDDNTSSGKTQTPGGTAPAPAPAKNGTQPPAAQKGTTTSRYYQKRDREIAENTPNFAPSNGLLPEQQKSGSNKPKTGTGSSSMSSSGSSSSTSPNMNTSGR